jgi:2-oxoglutaroyl-CoA hydrolase
VKLNDLPHQLNSLPQELDGFTVTVDEKRERADIVLSRPPLNVISMTQREQLRLVFEALDEDERVRVIVLRAVGEHFSSGGDIRGFLEASPEHVSKLAWNIAAPARCSKPVIAAGRGYCFGVGFEISLACDFRWSPRRLYALPEQKLGQIPGSGGSARLQKMVGITRTKDIVMRSRRISGEAGGRLGRRHRMRPRCRAGSAATDALVDELRAFRRWPSAPPRSSSTTPRTPPCPSRSSWRGIATAAAPVRTTFARASRPSTPSAPCEIHRALKPSASSNAARSPGSNHNKTSKRETTMNTATTTTLAACLLARYPELASHSPRRARSRSASSRRCRAPMPIGQQVRWGLELAAGKSMRRRHRRSQGQAAVRRRGGEPVRRGAEGREAVPGQKVDFLTGTVNSGSTLAVAQLAERNNKLIATTVSFADSITTDKCSPNMFRVNARAEHAIGRARGLARQGEAASQCLLPRA